MSRNFQRIVYVQNSERMDGDEYSAVLAVTRSPPHEIVFEQIWEEAAREAEQKDGYAGVENTLRVLRKQGWGFKHISDVPISYVEVDYDF